MNSPSPITECDVVLAYELHGLDIPAPVVLASTDSTNSDAVALADSGSPEWTVVVANYQRAGRGRLDRHWTAEPGQALLFSAILRPTNNIAPESLSWVPLLAGIAAAQAIQAMGVPASLKWPNDVVVEGTAADAGTGPRKVAGILCERTGSAVVVGVGVNITTTLNELPVSSATSLAIEGVVDVDRAELLADAIANLRTLWSRFGLASGNPVSTGLLDRYRQECTTLGRRVQVQMPGDDYLVGTAIDIDREGRLKLALDGTGQVLTVSAGDVVHLRRN